MNTRCLHIILVFLVADVARGQDSLFQFDANGNLLLQASATPGAPVIVSQPQMQVVAPGELASFFVLAANPASLSYQWRFYGTNIPSATLDVLLLSNVSTNNEGPYSVVLSNNFGSLTSAPAMLWIDSDDDGLPDTWERMYFGNLNQTATGDFDHDGTSNLDEFLNGTNPTNAASGIFTLTVAQDGGFVQAMPAQDSYTYGQIVSLTAAPVAPDTFHGWTGDVFTRSNVITLVMTNNKSLYAHFAPIDFNWTNQLGGDWFTAANWSPNLVPATNDNVIIALGVTVTLNSDAECYSLNLGTASLAPTLSGNATLTASGACTWTSGTMNGSGRTVIDTGGSLAIVNPATVSLQTGRTLENAGTILWTGAGDFNLSGGAVLTNRAGALFSVQNSASFLGAPGALPRVDNAGTFRKSVSAGTTGFGSSYPVPFHNYGTVDLQTGGLAFNGGLNNGDIAVPANTTLSLSGASFVGGAASSITGAGNFFASGNSISLNGLFNISGPVTISIGSTAFIGNVICTNNTLNIPSGTATFSGTGTVTPALLNLTGGTLDGTMLVTAGSSMSWSGGAMTGSGRTLVPPGLTLTINNASTVYLTTRTLENGGTILWTGTADFSASQGAVITNRAGALFSTQGSGSFLGGPGALPRVDNAGIFRKSVSAGTTGFGSSYPVPFFNYGTVDLQSGGLAFNGGLNNGDITVPASTTLSLSGASFVGGAGSTITGAGNFFASGNSISLNGLFNISGPVTISIGSTAFIGNVICTNNTLNIPSGTATFSGTGTVTPAVLNLTGGTLDGTMLVTVGGSTTWSGGGMTGSGRTLVPPGVTLTINNAGTVYLTTRTLENGGTILWTGAADFSASQGAVITNRAGALFSVQGSGSFLGAPGALPRVDNAGTFRKSVSAGTTGFGSSYPVPFHNYGTVDLQTGGLAFNGGLNNGDIAVPANTTLSLSGASFVGGAASSITGAGNFFASGNSISLNGLFNISGPVTISIGSTAFIGNVICTNNTLNIPSGTATFSGTGTVTPALLNLTGGTLDGTMLVTAGSSMSWSGGAMTGSGRTLVPPGVTLTINNAGLVYLDTRTLENGGTILWTGTADFSPTKGAAITNRAGALFSVQGTGSFLGGPGAFPRVDNAGTFRKSVSIGTTAFGSAYTVLFYNYGTLDIQGGVLAANGGYFCSSDSTLNCALWGTTPGATYGQLQVPGTVNLNGTLSVNLTNHYVPATNDMFTVLSAGTRSGTFANFIYPSNNVSMALSNAASSEIVRVTGVTQQQTNPLTPAAGIVSWWRAENDAKDAVGTNNGVLTNGAAFAVGKVGQSFLLDGTNGYVVIPDSPSLRPVSVTLEGWVLFSATNGFRLIMGKPVGSGNLDSFALWLSDGVLNGVICDTVSGGPVISYAMLPVIGRWYHLAYTYNGATLQQVLYVNGAAVETGTGYHAAGYDTHPMVIGSDNDNGVQDGFFSGQIDEATVYNRALGANEIASIYNVGTAGKQPLLASQPILHLERTSPTAGRLYWSTNYPDFHLEYNTSLAPSNWAAWALPLAVQGTNYIATNSFLTLQKFYRLSRVPAPFITPPPALKIERVSPTAVRLLWPVEDERSFHLQSTTNLNQAIWTPLSQPPVRLGGDNSITNSISEPRRYYRFSNP